jgi:hypothetical protein
MGLLNRFFKSQEELAKDVALKDDDFLRAWNEYHKTVNEKSVLIEFLSKDNYLQTVPKLQKLLDLELSEIEGEKKTEKQLVDDLKSIEHDKRIQKVKNLFNRLCYAESKYTYIYKLLNELHNAIVAQLHIVEKLSSANDVDTLISHLKSQSAVESEVIKQIETRETFHGLFLALVKGEQIIGRMDAKEKQLLKRMSVILTENFRIRSLPGPQRKKGLTYEWSDKVYTGILDQVGEYIARHEEDDAGNNPDVDFEFVNHPEFFDFVRKCAKEVGLDPSEQMINVFVHVFRELYNDKK